MNEEYSFRPEFEYREEYPAPPDEYGAKSKGAKSKKKRLAQLLLYSWVTLMIGGAAAVTADDAQCTVTLYDADGNTVIEQTVSASELETLPLPNGTYLLSEGGEIQISEGRLSSELADDISPSEDGVKHIGLYPAT